MEKWRGRKGTEGGGRNSRGSRSEKAKGLCLIVSAESHMPNPIDIHVRLCSSNTLQH